MLTRHYDRFYSICRRITGNDADAADATQEALMAVVRGLNRFEGNAAFSTWSYRVATNACFDEMRRKGRRPTPQDPTTGGDDLDASARSFDDTVVDHDIVRGALASLAPPFREAVVLRDIADLDYQEIANVLGLPIGTVRSRIARGRASLAEIVGNQTNGGQRRSTRDD